MCDCVVFAIKCCVCHAIYTRIPISSALERRFTVIQLRQSCGIDMLQFKCAFVYAVSGVKTARDHGVPGCHSETK